MADVTDSKSVGITPVWVQVPPPAPVKGLRRITTSVLFLYIQDAFLPASSQRRFPYGGKNMDYRRFEDTLIIRIDKGEEITEKVAEIAEKEKIRLAEVHALGAINEFTVGLFDSAEKKFYPNSFQGLYEIVSLHGTISTIGGKFYQHLHMSAGDRYGHVFGGHLSRAVVSATCEMVIRIINGNVDRAFDPEIGLNLFRF